MSTEENARSEKSLELYYDHYKDTFSYLRTYIATRDRIFYITLGLLIAIFFQSNNPDVAKNISAVLVKKNIGDSIYIDVNFINSLLLFAFLSLVIKYFQLTLLIERQYPYLHAIEEELTLSLGVKITREGKSYVEAYPFVLSVIHRIYSLLFPGVLVAVIIVKFLNELKFFGNEWKNGYFIFDSLILFFILAITAAYISWAQFKDFQKPTALPASVILEAPEELVAPEFLDGTNDDKQV